MSAQPRRIRLKPWLMAQVNSNRYPGLHWLTPDHRLFQIPWKHATRHTPTSEEENTIFKAWALETGKYQEGVDEPDPAKWKANLRNALNKSREFQLKYDGTKETPLQPYKVYEVCEQHAIADPAEEDEDEMPNLMDLNINPNNEASNYAPFPPHAEANHFALPHVLSVPPQPITEDFSQPEFQAQGQMLAQENSINPGPLSDLDSLPTADLMETSNMSGVQNEDDGQNQTFRFDLLSSIPLTDLDLKFLYRGKSMGTQTVSNPHGCRLYYGHLEPTPNQVELFGPVTLQQVRFPGASEIHNQKQRTYTGALLDVMDRGLMLEFWQMDIYAVRLCQCKVFWSGMGVPEQGPPNPMERERKIKVFSLNDFLEGLIMFHKGEAQSPPPFETYFCFGEDWPDRKPKERKLIIVQVVPVVARILTEMFAGDLSWSNDSIRLQISNPDVNDQTVMQFKEIQRLLQSQYVHGPWNPNP